MQKLASWLSASTLNAALAAAGLFIVAPPLAGAVCILMVLQRGLPAAVNVAALVVGAQVLIAAIAAAVFAAEAATNPAGYAFFVAVSLALMLGVGLLLARLRSVTLVAQVIVLAGVGAVLFFSAGIVDLQLLLKPWTDMFEASLSNAGVDNAAELTEQMLFPLLPFLAASILWFALTISMYLGYALYASAGSQGFDLGRFRDLNLGRVLAALLAVASVLATLTQSPLVANVALLLLVAFLLQGFSLLHWVAQRRGVSPWLLFALYAALFLIPGVALLTVPIAVAGYIDAWFNLRGRMVAPAGPN